MKNFKSTVIAIYFLFSVGCQLKLDPSNRVVATPGDELEAETSGLVSLWPSAPTQELALSSGTTIDIVDNYANRFTGAMGPRHFHLPGPDERAGNGQSLIEGSLTEDRDGDAIPDFAVMTWSEVGAVACGATLPGATPTETCDTATFPIPTRASMRDLSTSDSQSYRYLEVSKYSYESKHHETYAGSSCRRAESRELSDGSAEAILAQTTSTLDYSHSQFSDVVISETDSHHFRVTENSQGRYSYFGEKSSSESQERVTQISIPEALTFNRDLCWNPISGTVRVEGTSEGKASAFDVIFKDDCSYEIRQNGTLFKIVKIPKISQNNQADTPSSIASVASIQPALKAATLTKLHSASDFVK